MENPLGIHWFSPAKQAASLKRMNVECVKLANKLAIEPAPHFKKFATKAGLGCGGVALIGLALFLGILSMMPKKGAEPNYVAMALILIILPSVVGYVSCWFFKHVEAAKAERFNSFTNIKAISPGLTPLFETPIGPYPLPVMFCVDKKPTHNACLTGVHNGRKLNWIKAGHTFDIQGPDGPMIGRNKRITSRSIEAIVFQQPLTHLPDLFIGPKSDVFALYLKKAIKRSTTIPGFSSLDQYALTSDASSADTIVSAELFEICKSSLCFIQAVRGCVVVHMSPEPEYMITKPEEIKKALDLAVSVYDALSRTGKK